MTESDDIPVAGTVVLLRDGASGPEVLLLRRPDRGSFASGWVFPGGKVEPGDVRPNESEREDALRAGVRETFEEVGVRVDGLVVLSRWQPPEEAPKRIRTWFFLARDPGTPLIPAPDEVVETSWIRPADALQRHGAGEWTLFPPTWVTLHHLSSFADAAAALAAAGGPEFYATRVRRSAEGTFFAWAGDAEHEDGGEGRHRLEAHALPWRYVRD